MNKIKIAVVCKLMPLYRLGVFQKLSSLNEDLEFTFFGDTKNCSGIETIDWSYSNKIDGEGIRWIKTNNYFYKPELLLWQTGIIKNILFSKYKVFIFEGAVSHFPIWLFALLCQIRNKKVLFWTHGFNGSDKGFKKWIRLFFFKHLCNGVLLYGKKNREIMISYGLNPDSLFVIYNSLRTKEQFQIFEKRDQNLIKKEKEHLFKNSKNTTIIFIGRLVAHKGILEIVKVCNNLIKTGLELNCIFIGEGPEKEILFNYIQENELQDNIHFTGSLYNENDIAKYFVMSDLMVSPGNVGLNCIHSLTYGVPVLTHDNFTFQNPEVEAIIDGENGVFYKYNDFENLQLKLENWISTSRNKEVTISKCQEVIKNSYNPVNQANCIVAAVKNIIM